MLWRHFSDGLAAAAAPYDHIPFPADAIYDHWGHNNGAGIVAADNRTLLVDGEEREGEAGQAAQQGPRHPPGHQV